MRPLTRVIVVIPARNEEQRLPAALEAVDQARRLLAALDPRAPEVAVWVVADRCTDRTQQIAQGWPGVRTVQSDHGNVGAARAAGVIAAIGNAEDPALATLWIACTDADSQVPPDWLISQARHARNGTDLLLGTVRPDPKEMTSAVSALWFARHELDDGHPHIHGANMGIRADTYRRAGGFPSLAEHEDVQMVERIRQLGATILSTGDSPVLTSARPAGRTPAGMAGYLTQLGRQQPLAEPRRLGPVHAAEVGV